MKKLLLLLCVSYCFTAKAQSWAAPGATWYYGCNCYSGPGYERITRIGDTIINGKEYDKLQRFYAWYDSWLNHPDSMYVPELALTREDSGVVYLRHDTTDYVFFDFNAHPGDSWLLATTFPFSGGGCDTGTVITDSTSFMVANGDTLRMIYTHPLSQAQLTIEFLGPVIEKIGGIASFFPYQGCLTDMQLEAGLRCYSDSTGWSWHNPSFPQSCDFTIGINENAQAAVSVIANPALQQLQISCPQMDAGALIRVYDSRGQLLLEQETQTYGAATIRLPAMSRGIYFISVTDDAFMASRSFIYAGN